MRSSKNRQRSKQNRPRTLGNIINRVFDSSGPEGKVRGTPQQIIEKYLLLARDAQLSNDRVAAENFLQHAEHYTRMLAEAQREMAAEQEARRVNQGQQGQQGQGSGQGGQPWRDRNGQSQPRDDRSEAEDLGGGFDVVEPQDDSDLVELPEMRADTPSEPQRDRPRDQQRPNRDQRPPREDRRDDRGPRDQRPPREDRGPREDRPPRDQRPPREDRRPSFLRAPLDQDSAETPAQPSHDPQPMAEAVPVAAEPVAAAPVAHTAPPETAAEQPKAPRRKPAPRKPKAEGTEKPEAAE